jgi:hypothetical protein
VNLEAHQLEKFMLELAESGQSLSQWPVWWHSHGSMNAFASPQDEKTLASLAQEYDGVALGLVTNKDGEYYAWWAGVFKNEYGNFPMSGKMDVMYEQDEEPELEELVKSMMVKVTIPVPSNPYSPALMDGSGYWLNGKFIYPFKEKSHRKKRKKNSIFDDEQEEAFYKLAQQSYGPETVQSKMALGEFAEWMNEHEKWESSYLQYEDSVFGV